MYHDEPVHVSVINGTSANIQQLAQILVPLRMLVSAHSPQPQTQANHNSRSISQNSNIVLILDQGVSTSNLLQQQRTCYPDTLIIVAGEASYNRQNLMLASGATDYITYPFCPDEVLNKFRFYHQHCCLQRQYAIHHHLLERQSERWTLLLEGTGDGIFDWNIRTDHLVLSAHWMSMLGYRPEELVGDLLTWVSLLHPDDRDRALNTQEAYLNRDIPEYRNEFRLRCADGSYKWILSRGQAVWDKEGRPTRMVGAHQDISQRKQVEVELDQYNALLKHTEKSSKTGGWLVNFETGQEIWTEGTYRIFGLSNENLLPSCVDNLDFYLSFFPTESRDIVREAFYSLIDHGNPYALETPLMNAQGDQLWIRIVGQAIYSADRLVGCMGNLMDISDRKANELALQHSESRLKEAQHVAQVGSWEVDRQAWTLQWSEEIYRMLGLDPSQFSPDPDQVFDLIHPEDKPIVQEMVERALQSGEPYEIEHRVYHSDGSIRYFVSKGKPIYNTSGEMTKLFGTVLDVSDRKQLELALKASEAQLSNILDSIGASVGNFYVDQDNHWETIYHSLGCISVFGYSLEEFSVDLWLSSIVSEDYQTFFPEALKAIREERTATFEYRYYHPTGEIRWIADTFTSRWDPQTERWVVTLVGVDISDRKAAEEKIQVQQQFLNDIMKTVPCAIFVRDSDGKFLTLNQAASEIHGVSPEQLIGKYETEVNPCFSAERLRKILDENQRVIQSGRSQSFWDQRLITASGEERWFHTYLIPYLKKDGEIIGVIGASIDVTENKHIGQALRESESRFRTIFENAQIGIVVCTLPEFRFSLVNPFFEELLGYSTEELSTLSWQQISYCDPSNTTELDVSTNVDIGIEHILNQGRPESTESYQTEQRFICKTGEMIWTHLIISALRNSQGQVIGIIALVEDISDRKRAELALRDSENRFRNLIEQTTDWVWQIDAEGSFIYVSPQVESILGYPPSHILGKNMLDFIAPPERDHIYHVLSSFTQDITSFTRLEKTLIRRDGVAVILESSASPVIDMEGKMQGYRGISRDITERKQAETRLKQAKQEAEAANLAKSQFLANMSHELRTPLNAILGFAQIMHYDSHLTNEHQGFIQTILQSGEHLLELINEVLDLSKIEAGHATLDLSTVYLPEFLQSLTTMLHHQASSKGLQLEFHLDRSIPPYVTTDQHKLRQVLINLLGNAIKFTDDGQVTLRVVAAMPVDVNQDYLRQVMVTFEVKDTGIGISPEDQLSVFEAFEQVKHDHKFTEGTGLGLTISNRLVELMGGKILLHSSLGEGSTFYFSIPMELATTSAEPNYLPSLNQVVGISSSEQRYRVLVADDRYENSQFIQQILCAVGFDAMVVENGEEAIATWRTWHPHLILMDLNMPSIDGYAATRLIRAEEQSSMADPSSSDRLKHTVIIAMSASTFERDRTYAIGVGCDDFLSKPVHLKALFEKIQDHLPVQYLYSPSSRQEAYPDISAEMLDIMPISWIQALYDSTVICDSSRINHLLQDIPISYPELRNGLGYYSDSDRLDLLLELLGNYLHNSHSLS